MKKFLLKQKVAFTLILVSISSLLVVSFVVFLFIKQTAVTDRKTNLLYLTSEQTHESILTFRINQQFARLLSKQTQIIDFLNSPKHNRKTEAEDALLNYTNNDKKYLAIYILDKNGIGMLSTDPRFVGQDYSFRNYFKKAISGKSAIDVAVGKTSNQLGYYFAEPVINKKGDILGVIVVKIDQSVINNQILINKSSLDNVVMLTDEYGVILFSNESDRNLKSIGKLPESSIKILKENQRYLSKDIVPLQYDLVEKNIRDYKNPISIDFKDEEDKENESLNIVKVGDLPFYIVTEMRFSYLDKEVLSVVLFISFLVALILILISLSIYYSLVSFIKPIDKFKMFFNRISNGSFLPRLEVDTGDEFSEMADRVNKMAADLSDLYHHLDEKVKEQTVSIEKKVKESENQNKEILNMLNEVQKEKANIEMLVNDLEKFKLAVENASDQIIITDPEGIVIYGNKAVERITGYNAEEALGKKAGALWKLPMHLEYYKNLWDIIKRKKETFVGEIQNKRKSGDIYTAFITISSVINDEGEIIYFVAIERDITKEKEIDKAKTEFVSLASHQLRTPLSAINWYTEMLLHGDAGQINDEERKYLNEIAIGNKRMVTLVSALLNVSKLDMGTLTIQTNPVDIVEITKSIIKECKPQILEKEIVIEEIYGDNISKLPADEKLLRMILQNLISNAVKYSFSRGVVTINISTLKRNESVDSITIDEDSIVFIVSDHGMGIPFRQKDKIFTKLFRADNAKETETEGTGLGLYLVKSIVDQSGGRVWFKSQEGKGATFYLIFPITGMKTK